MKRNIITWLMLLGCITIWAQGVKPLPTLHVEGRWLVDKHGNQVVLHGVMDTPSNYFNGGRWHGKWVGQWTDGEGNKHDVYDNYSESGKTACLDYFEKLFTGMEQAKCNVFRLHMDPAWTNDGSITATGFTKNAEGKTIDPNGQVVGGEADISHFSETLYRHWLPTLYLELVKKAMNHGMFVVVRPPGVCPGNLKVSDYYNQYLMLIWDIFSQQDFVKQHAGQISIELANEPVSIKNAQNQDDLKALHNFFQPIVDKIRANGFTGIIWVPGTSWQQNYTSYVQYPIIGDNIGYAVHDYNGWYGCDDKDLSASDVPEATKKKIDYFHSQVPVVDTNPVIITEIDWSPENPNAQGHYNEHGVWVLPNYGTWATGRTSVWGNITKGVYDHFGNISMTLSGTGCLLDIDKLLSTNTAYPAFDGLAEACGKACMDWYSEYYNVNWPHADDEAETGPAYTIQSISAATGDIEMEEGGNLLVSLKAVYADGHTQEICDQATYTFDDPTIASANKGYIKGQTPGSTKVTATYTDKNGQQYQTTFNVTVNAREFFSFKKEDIREFFGDTGTYDEATRTFHPGQWGQMGWQYDEGVDMSSYKYLVVKLKTPQNCSAHLNIFPQNSIWGSCYQSEDFGSKTMIVIKMADVAAAQIDTKNIHIISFWTNGTGDLVVDDVYLTNNDDYSKQTTGITTIQRKIENDVVYNLQGVKVGSRNELKSLPRGIYIIGGKKVVVK